MGIVRANLAVFDLPPPASSSPRWGATALDHTSPELTYTVGYRSESMKYIVVFLLAFWASVKYEEKSSVSSLLSGPWHGPLH